jgi:hypothetical protein
LLTTSVASASPSTSSAMIASGRPAVNASNRLRAMVHVAPVSPCFGNQLAARRAAAVLSEAPCAYCGSRMTLV